MKIVLAGSPQISVKAFENIINNFDVVAIVTQPDRHKGRGMKMVETPVAELGKKHGIKTFKPEKILSIYDELSLLDFDLFLSFAFGQWIPTKVLSLGKSNPLNIHGSLLPKYRGAAPIHYAILNGDKEIGITLMEMIKEMDAGDMFFKASQPIDENTTTGEAFGIIGNLAADNIVEWLKKVESGDINPEKQPEDFSLSPKIKKSEAELKEGLTTHEAMRKIKGLNPFPGAYTFIDGKRVKIFNASKEEKPNLIELKFKDGDLYVSEYQYEGKKKIKIN